MHALGQFGVGLSAASLKLGKQLQVGAVELDGRHIRAPVKRLDATIMHLRIEARQQRKPVA